MLNLCGWNVLVDDIALPAGHEEISCLIWADDILILSETEKGLQEKLNGLASYCKKNKLEVNTDKTKTIYLRRVDVS